jgi:CRISPR-associated endonuclease Cas1
MAATQTVPQDLHDRNSLDVMMHRDGVLTLFGYGIRVTVNHGHLEVEDGIGTMRRAARFARIRHGLRRLIVVGADGIVSLAALRWLADQDASFVMLDRDGSVLATTGPVCPSDARLRRAQVLAHHSGAALRITRELIDQKLEGQERVARESLKNGIAVSAISRAREGVATANTTDAIRFLESRAAHAYWSAWRTQLINFPKNDLRRVPEHWQSFGARISPLTGSPRLAANPPNAMLNYLYALLESETRLALAALGLDPGLGLMHTDEPSRDSLACDVMEPVRPQVDEYVLGWVSRETLLRRWFFEQRDGCCRLMGDFAAKLSETSPTWRRAVAPMAERVAQLLWSSTPHSRGSDRSPTRLTQHNRREAKGLPGALPAISPPRSESFCTTCGVEIGKGRTSCVDCAKEVSAARLIQVAKNGRIASHSKQAQQLRSESRRRHAAARAEWQTEDLPPWLTEEFYRNSIRPRLRTLSISKVASALAISVAYAVDVRKGRRVPHPRHWLVLARLVDVPESRLPNRATHN